MRHRQRRAFRSAALATAVAAIGAAALSSAVGAGRGAGTVARVAIERHDPAPAKRTVEHDLEGPVQQAAGGRSARTRSSRSSPGTPRRPKRDGSQVVKLGKSKYVELGRREDRQDLHDPGRVRRQGRRHHDVRPGRPDGPKPPGEEVRRRPRPGCTTRSPSRTAPRTTARPGRRTTTRSTSRTSTSRTARRSESLKKYYEKQSSGRYSVDGEVSDWVKVDYNEARYGSNYCGDTNCANVWDAGPRRRQRSGPRTRRPPAAPTRRSRRTWPSTTSGTATTSTATATSTSPTATSTTSRSCTPARTSPRAAAPRATNAIWAHRWYAYGTDAGKTGPGGQQGGRHPDRRHRHLGRRLHHAAGERRPRRLRPRVRPRPRPAGPLRHHRQRRELRRLLVADVRAAPGSAPARTPSATCPAT